MSEDSNKIEQLAKEVIKIKDVSIFGLLGLGYSKLDTDKMSMAFSSQSNDWYYLSETFKKTGLNVNLGVMTSWKRLTIGLGYDTFPSGATLSVGVNVF